MITQDQAREYLASIGITLPGFMLTLLLGRVATIEPCLEANYDESTAALIQLYVIGLMGIVQGDRYVTSQTAPSGASQSFRFGTLSERYRAALSLLNNLDTSGCASSIVPAEPGPSAALFVGRPRHCNE